MHQRGFTIIELAIALSVSLILAGVAIPRFDSLLNQENFYGEVQKVTACIQQAQAMAVAPNSALLSTDASGNSLAVRWTAAELSAADSTNNQTCSVEAFDATQPLTALALAIPTNQLATPVQTQGIANLTLPAFRIYFGVTEKGVPVEYVDGTTTNRSSTPNSGMKITLPVQSTVDSTLNTTISVEEGGVPVRILSSPTP